VGPTLTRVVVERSRTKGLLALGGCVVFVVLCLLIATTGHPVALAIAVLGIVTFGTFGALWVRQLFRSGPGLVVDDHGFDDASSAIGVGRVPWSDVTHVSTWGMPGSRNVVVHVRNPGDHLERLGWFARRSARANISLVGSPVVLNANTLRTDTDCLVRLLREGHERHSGSFGVVPPSL
jgi:hypothetical protein